MDVHHHSITHVKKNWKTYIWEFLMLFLAVFCGFLAEYQLEKKIEKDQETEFVRSLVADLKEDTVILAETIGNLNSNVKRMDTMIHLLNSNDIKEHGADLYYLGRRASRSMRLAINDRTIQQMKNSGGFRLIRNENASTAIMDYYSMLSFIEMLQTIDLNEQNSYKELAIDVFHPVIFDSIALPGNEIIRPNGNPLLLTYDSKILLRLSGMISYMKNSRMGLAKQEANMKAAAVNLISIIKKEYHLE